MMYGQPAKTLLVKDNPGDGVPVFVLTLWNREAGPERAYELLANSYFVNPVNFEASAGAVQQLDFSWLLLSQAPQQ